MTRTILVLGAGVMQLPALRAARRLGLYVVVADGNDRAVGRDLADEFLHVDLKDEQEMVRAAQAISGRRGLHAVFTAGTDFTVTVARVAEALRLPGNRYEAAVNATDKYRMRRVLREAGVRVPDFAVLTREEAERDGCRLVADHVALPVVVKPVDSMGARGVVRADSWSEADKLVREAIAYSRSGRAVVEGYVDGPEFSLDAIVCGTDIQITGFADRLICFPPCFVEMGHTIPTELPACERQAIEQEFKHAILALGIGPGAAKGDVKLSSAGVVIGEVAARLSGGYMSGWTYPLASGVSLTEIAIRVALGDTPPRVRAHWARTSAERAVISIPGVLRRLEGLETARSIAGIEEVFVTRSVGDRVAFPRNNVEKVGNVIAVAETRADAVDTAQRAVRSIVPVLDARDEHTDRFLFAAREAVPPDQRHDAFDALADTEGDLLASWRVALRGGDRATLELTLPPELRARTDRDWACRTPCDVLMSLSSDRRARIRPGKADTLGQLLLRAIARGGLQGSRYVLDSLVRAS